MNKGLNKCHTQNTPNAHFACFFQGIVGMPGPAGPRGHPGPPVNSYTSTTLPWNTTKLALSYM